MIPHVLTFVLLLTSLVILRQPDPKQNREVPFKAEGDKVVFGQYLFQLIK